MSKTVTILEQIKPSSSNLLEKQSEYVNELTLAEIDMTEICDNISVLQTEVDKILEKRKTEIKKPSKKSWNKIGWYPNIQTNGIKNYYKKGLKGMCYNCCDMFNTAEEAMTCQWTFILSDDKVPSFMSKNFTRLYLICSKCETNGNYISPPKTWQEALISSTYNKVNNKIMTITQQIMHDTVISQLSEKSQQLLTEEQLLNQKVEERKTSIKNIKTILQKHDEMYELKSNKLADVISDKSKRLAILQKDEDELRQQIDGIEQRLINYRKQLAKQMSSIRTDINTEFDTLDKSLSSSYIGKLSEVLKSTDDSMCQVCYSEPINIVLDPCGHLFICETCYHALPNTCPICRAHVTKAIKTYKP